MKGVCCEWEVGSIERVCYVRRSSPSAVNSKIFIFKLALSSDISFVFSLTEVVCSFNNTDNSLPKCSTFRFNCSFSISSDVLASRNTRFSRSAIRLRVCQRVCESL